MGYAGVVRGPLSTAGWRSWQDVELLEWLVSYQVPEHVELAGLRQVHVMVNIVYFRCARFAGVIFSCGRGMYQIYSYARLRSKCQH